MRSAWKHVAAALLLGLIAAVPVAIGQSQDGGREAAMPSPQKTTIKTEVVTGLGSARAFVGPVTITLAPQLLFRDPFTGKAHINEVNTDVTCDNLQAGTDVVIFNCTLQKDIKYKTLTLAATIPPNLTLGPEGGIVSLGDVVHTTVWINFSGAADVPGARPGDSVQLEGFVANHKQTPTNCVNFVDLTSGTTLTNAICSTLEEKDDILLTFKTTRTQQLQITPDP